jgi:hypothetical protein
MKNMYVLTFTVSFFLIACKSKKDSKTDKSTNSSISVLSIFNGQVNHIDTSLYQVTRLDTKDGKTDTTYIRREDVRELAAPFLSLPDISRKDYEENYTEERFIDETQNSLSITATAKKEGLEILKQIIIVPIDDLASGKVQSIFIDRQVQQGDSSVEQKLFWQVNKFFQVGSIIQKDANAEQTKLLKVTWE